jgi:hypothetical protein
MNGQIAMEIAGAAMTSIGDAASGGPAKHLAATADAQATRESLDMAFDTVGLAIGAFLDALN